MKRLLLNLLTALSLLLCAAAAALWVRSYWGTDYLSRRQPVSSSPWAVTSRIHEVAWTRGTIRFSTAEHVYYPRGQSIAPVPSDPPTMWGWAASGPGT